jgi:hypothetical protein
MAGEAARSVAEWMLVDSKKGNVFQAGGGTVAGGGDGCEAIARRKYHAG